MTKKLQKKCAAILGEVTKNLREVKKLTKDEYREKIRAILIRFQKDELMSVNKTVDEIVDQIVEIELPEKG